MFDQKASTASGHTSLQVSFGPVSAGWLAVEIRLGEQEVCLEGSAVFSDPFPQLVAWLECVHRNQAARFEFDEEDESPDAKWFIYEPGAEGRGRFSIRSKSRQEAWLDCEISTAELAGTFYRALHRFANSPDYEPEEWEFTTNSKFLEQHTGLNRHSLPAHMARLSRRELVALMNAAHTRDPAWDGAESWESMNDRERRQWGRELLREDYGDGYDGAPLSELTSRTLDEAYGR